MMSIMHRRLWTPSVIFVLQDIGGILRQTIYPQLCYLVYWLNSISADNTFVEDFKHLLHEHPSVNARLMGFPAGWENEPLWK